MKKPAHTPGAITYARNSSSKQRSIQGQADENRAECARLGWTVVAELSDGTSASRYARRPRENWAELLKLVPTVDAVVIWEASRGDRTLSSWVKFLDLCREHGTLVHATGHATTYDPAKPRDYHGLVSDGNDASYESDKTSLRLRRGMATQAANGRPHGHTSYGYQRIYDPTTRELVRQEPHPEHAAIVREIVRRVGQGDALSVIARHLTERGVPTPEHAARWQTRTVSRIAVAKAYIGVRVHRPKSGPVTESAAVWPALVTSAEHYAAARVLGDPARRAFIGPRHGRASTLLGMIAVCGTCGKAVRTRRTLGGKAGWWYACCSVVPLADLDAHVVRAVLHRLADPAVYVQLRHLSDDDDRAAVQARAEVDKLTAELDTWRQSAVDGQTTPGSLAVIEAGLTSRVDAARRRAETASTPPALRQVVGPARDLRKRWQAAPLGARREIVKTLLTVTVHSSVGRGRDLTGRVDITWRT